MNDGVLSERVGRQLMAAVAAAPESPAAARFDEFFYPRVLRHVRKRHHALGATASRLLGRAGNLAPRLEPQQLDEAAQRTAIKALERARASAPRFDPKRGTVLAWVLRSAALAYVDVARELAETDRRFEVVATSDEELERHLSRESEGADPFEVATNQDTLDRYFALLTKDEEMVILAFYRYGFSYVEIAEVVFRDGSKAKRVDKLLQSARLKAKQMTNQEVL